MRPFAALFAGVVLATSIQAAAPPADLAVKAAVVKALKRAEQGVINYPKHRRCFSCHHQAMAVLSMTAARDRGFAIDADLLRKQIDFSLRTFRNKTAIASGRGVGGDSTGVVYALHTFAAAEGPYDDTTAALVKYLLVKQRRDGAWPIPAFGNRPPTMGSLFTNTGLAVSALKRYPPPKDAPGAADLQARIDTALLKGTTWLLTNKPASTEDRVFHLWGLVSAGVGVKVIGVARGQLLDEQRPDGSWAQLPRMAGDAYATATALVALRRAGLDVGHESYKRGVKYLLDHQNEDGAWIVRTRSRPLQVFFDNGDPGGKSQFISFAATNWAILALLETMPRHQPDDAGKAVGVK
jgi:N-acyl-D-amino-acid deacylase